MFDIFNLSQNTRAKENPIKPGACTGHSAIDVSPWCSLKHWDVGQPHAAPQPDLFPAPAFGSVVPFSVDKHILACLTLSGSMYWNCFSYCVRNTVGHSVFSSATKSLLRIWNILKPHSINVASLGAQDFSQQCFQQPQHCLCQTETLLTLQSWWKQSGNLRDAVGGPWLGMGYVGRAGIQGGWAAAFLKRSSTHIPLPYTFSFELKNNSWTGRDD